MGKGTGYESGKGVEKKERVRRRQKRWDGNRKEE